MANLMDAFVVIKEPDVQRPLHLRRV
jgi:hypothetical protein